MRSLNPKKVVILPVKQVTIEEPSMVGGDEGS